MFGACVTATLLSIPPLLLIKYLNYKCEHNLNICDQLKKDVEKDQFKNMFVTHKNRLCTPHLNTRLVCGSHCSYLYIWNIVNLINQAKESVSLCMYHCTIDDIHSALINAHNRGINVRIISDGVMVSSSGSKITELSRKGIPVKTQKSKVGLMHHKFMIIDQSDIKNGRVIYGSLNYTINALINNWEVAMLTNSCNIVKRFGDEFDFIWNLEEFSLL